MRQAAVIAFALVAIGQHAGAQNGSASSHEMPNQFVISLPGGWSAYDQGATAFNRTDGLGMMIFSAQPITKDGAADPELLAKADTGEIASFFVDRLPAKKDAACAKLSRNTIYQIGMLIGRDPSVGPVPTAAGGLPRHSDIGIGGCAGVKLLVDSKSKNPQDRWTIDVRAVSDGKVLYLFTLRSRADRYATNLPPFDSAMATLRFTRTDPTESQR